MNTTLHIPYLSKEEKIFLNTTATYSQARRSSRSSNSNMESSSSRPSMDDTSHHGRSSQSHHHQIMSVSTLTSLWKRRDSAASSMSSASSSASLSAAGSAESHAYSTMTSSIPEEEHPSPKAKELESLIFEQPQRTVRLSLTPRCAV